MVMVGGVFLRGDLVFAWDAGDESGRWLAAVQLVRIGAASRTNVAAAFGVNRESVRRWANIFAEQGTAGLVPERRGPKGPSKMTQAKRERIIELRAGEASYDRIAAEVGVSATSVRRVLADQIPQEEPEAASDPVPSGAAPTLAELPVLGEPTRRGGERVAAWLLAGAPPVFTGCARVPLAGLFLALPGVAASGLLDCAEQVYCGLPNGFYGLESMLVEGVLRNLVGEPRAEGATRVNPVDLGRILGLDRAPEVKTIRRRISQLAQRKQGAALQQALAAHHLNGYRPQDAAGVVLYVDGHVRAYTGAANIAKTHAPRLKFPAPATVETWVCDGAGDPVLVVMAQPSASLAGELRRLLPDLRTAVGDDRRVLVGFDRGGWSPALFQHMHTHGFDVLTWRKGPTPDVAAEEFAEVTHTDPSTGLTRTLTVADTMVELPIDGTDTVFGMRQVTKLDTRGGQVRQVHILTTRTDLPVPEVILRMGARWRVENYFRYAREHFDLDSHDSYQTSHDNPDRMVPNPARKKAHTQVLAARAALDAAQARADAAMLELASPTPGHPVTITNTQHNQVTADLHTAADRLAALEADYQAIPARLPLSQVNPGQQVLETETKLITHAIAMTAYNTITGLARDIRINTGYSRAADEAHNLARMVLKATGDIQPGPATLTITLDPLPTARATAAIRELAAHLTATNTCYPGTNRVLRYQVKNRP
jgi:transposase